MITAVNLGAIPVAVKRIGVVGAAVAVAVSMSATSARADDVSDILDGARDATYTATRLTVSVWASQTQLTRERVEHANGAEMVRVDETWTMTGNGRTVRMGDAAEGLAFLTQPASIATSRYEVSDVTPITHMHRNCTLVEITEDGVPRARMIVDDRTGAPLISYTYDASGNVFRTTSLSEFAPHRTYEWPQDSDTAELEIVMHGDPATVPESVGGYVLVDVFPGPGDSEQGFYSDGLFTFSLFVLPANAAIDGFESPAVLVVGDGIYGIVPTAKDTRVHWADRDHQYVMVGDLPPDHLTAVVSELPQPDRSGMISRLWRKLFG